MLHRNTTRTIGIFVICLAVLTYNASAVFAAQSRVKILKDKVVCTSEAPSILCAKNKTVGGIKYVMRLAGNKASLVTTLNYRSTRSGVQLNWVVAIDTVQCKNGKRIREFSGAEISRTIKTAKRNRHVIKNSLSCPRGWRAVFADTVGISAYSPNFTELTKAEENCVETNMIDGIELNLGDNIHFEFTPKNPASLNYLTTLSGDFPSIGKWNYISCD